MATTKESRVLWKGAISFGLVHIPVALHTATRESGLDFDWLDKRTMDPVGYKRINKKTGKEIERENIVKGIKVGEDHYAVLTNEEIAAAYPKSTQLIEIETFVPAGEIPFVYLERPYYLAPIGKGDKVYTLLREALLKAGRVAIARVVIQTKQHLAAVIPDGPALVLNLLRWGNDIRSWEALPLPAEGPKAAGVKESELEMALQLIEDMSSPWQPENFRDTFSEEVMALVHKKVEAGQTEQVVQPEAVQPPAGVGADIIDLAALLQRSLKPRNTGAATRPPKPSGHAAGHEKHAAGKSPARRHHA